MKFWTDVGFSECNLIPFLEDFFHAQIGIYISVLRSFKKKLILRALEVPVIPQNSQL